MNMELETMISRREAWLRSAATACLAGIALEQAVGLPALLSQGRQQALLSMAAIVLCVGAGWALALAPEKAARHVWRVVAATGVLVIAGWAAPRAFPVPGLVKAQGHWATLPGAALGA